MLANEAVHSSVVVTSPGPGVPPLANVATEVEAGVPFLDALEKEEADAHELERLQQSRRDSRAGHAQLPSV